MSHSLGEDCGPLQVMSDLLWRLHMKIDPPHALVLGSAIYVHVHADLPLCYDSVHYTGVGLVRVYILSFAG